MKKNIKVLGLSLCATLLLAGCSCTKKEDDSVKANINNGSEEIASGLTESATSVKLQALYDDLKAQAGNEKAAEKLLKIIADSIKSDTTWAARYDAKMEEKLMELIKSESYKVDGEFNEELLVKTLNSQTYKITCENNLYGPTFDQNGNVEEYLLCDYSDYKNKALDVEVLTQILNEKYIYEKVLKDKTNLLTTKKARLVEYISINKNEESSFDFLTESVEKLAAENSEVDLKEIEELWKNKLIEELMVKYNKINTKDDANGSMMQEFTGNYEYSKTEGLELKKKEIYEGNYYNEVVITSDSKDILNTTLVERILSENVLSETAEKTIKINDNYYLVSPLAGSNVDASDIRITDTVNEKYYLVKVSVINSESSDDLIYDAVKVLATNTSLVSDSVNYYLEQEKNNISIHDEEIYAYLKTQYADIFVD